MPGVGFDPTMLAIEQAKTFQLALMDVLIPDVSADLPELLLKLGAIPYVFVHNPWLPIHGYKHVYSQNKKFSTGAHSDVFTTFVLGMLAERVYSAVLREDLEVVERVT
jgi:hypothetical protein